jgi:hypothetical protein
MENSMEAASRADSIRMRTFITDILSSFCAYKIPFLCKTNPFSTGKEGLELRGCQKPGKTWSANLDGYHYSKPRNALQGFCSEKREFISDPADRCDRRTKSI